ncbi:2-dehydro-3-deoxy-6-phosphogalactonate aldolase [Beijerinckia indica]|uniref:KDPG and KHG aldolase n=1 Tax=Beijerinckia indica subsp. indica (strain ATCC 9039 / DSM 1715 / NCIMB 8712) TaxID=395963 RepID=B2IKG0_BEII9|nr:2-dehydro-3-deoxy-6-phosphogalactonate aldolase [Beijerinckia indica]ACB96440.1 KDPG and KHG aldolase [Beijerinckia indica subsp. indica ATCC 9039]
MTETVTHTHPDSLPKQVPWPKLKRNLVAILRGIKPDEVEAIGMALFEAGFDAIEVPLNSPEPLESIARLLKLLPAHVLIGAGTVTEIEQVDALAAIGGRLMVSPNFDKRVLHRAASAGLVTMPGIFTATEAFAAIHHGASALKFFPASVLGPGGIGAIKTVLPKTTVVGAVGGVSEEHFGAYVAVGVTAFGLGSSLYKPNMTHEDVAQRARLAVAAYDQVFNAHMFA